MGGGGARGESRMRRYYRHEFPTPKQGKPTEKMHWVPKQHWNLVKRVVQNIERKDFDTTDPLETDFHRYVHGKRGTKKHDYNAQVEKWLRHVERGGKTTSLEEFARFIAGQREKVAELFDMFRLYSH